MRNLFASLVVVLAILATIGLFQGMGRSQRPAPLNPGAGPATLANGADPVGNLVEPDDYGGRVDDEEPGKPGWNRGATGSVHPMRSGPAPDAGPARIVGTVRNVHGKILAQIQLNIYSGRFYGDRAIHTLRTDSSGSFEYELPLGVLALLSSPNGQREPADRRMRAALREFERQHELFGHLREDVVPQDWKARKRVAFTVKAQAQGFVTLAKTLELGWMAEGEQRMDFVLLEGTSFPGRVLLDEKLVAGAQVHAVEINELRSLSQSRTGRGGLYTLGVKDHSGYHLHARKSGWGAVVMQDVSLPPLSGASAPDLILRSGGFLKGQVRYRDGRPVEAAMIVAAPEGFGHMARLAIPYERLVLEEMRGGLYGDDCLSQEDGSFELPALASGTYAMRMPGLGGADSLDYPLHPTGSARVDLVYTGYRLRVKTDPSGADVRCRRIKSWTDELEFESVPMSTRSELNGDAFFPVEPHESYLIDARAPGFSRVWASIAIDKSRYEHKCFMQLYAHDSEGKPPGSSRFAGALGAKLQPVLELRVVDRAGAALSGFRAELRTEPQKRTSPDLRRVDVEDGALDRKIDPGRYALRLIPDNWRETYYLPMEWTEIFEIEPGQKLRKVLHPMLGGRLKLRVTWPAGSELQENEISLRLIAIGTRTRFGVALRSKTGPTHSAYSWLSPEDFKGSELRSEVVRAGEYRLLAFSQGRYRGNWPARLKAGVETALNVELQVQE